MLLLRQTIFLIHIYLIAKQEVNVDMCYTHLSRVFRRLNMLPVSRFQNFLCPGSDDGSSSNKSGRWNASEGIRTKTPPDKTPPDINPEQSVCKAKGVKQWSSLLGM